MKRLLYKTTLALIFCTLVAEGYCQTIDDKHMDELPVYIEIIGAIKPFNIHKMIITIDYGQMPTTTAFGILLESDIRDKNSEMITLNSMVEALNYMAEFGYKFMDSYVVTENDYTKYHYVLSNQDKQSSLIKIGTK